MRVTACLCTSFAPLLCSIYMQSMLHQQHYPMLVDPACTLALTATSHHTLRLANILSCCCVLQIKVKNDADW
jgi:hypothetical protein